MAVLRPTGGAGASRLKLADFLYLGKGDEPSSDSYLTIDFKLLCESLSLYKVYFLSRHRVEVVLVGFIGETLLLYSDEDLTMDW